MTRIVLAALAAFLAAPALAAGPCDDPGPVKGALVLHTPRDAAAATGKSAIIRIEGPADERAVWPADALRKLRPAPGSVIGEIKVEKGSLAGWKAPGVLFVKVDLSEATLGGSDFSGACFDHSVLNKADFANARLRGTRFEGSELAGVRFDGADLTGADLACSPGIVGEGCYTGMLPDLGPAETTIGFRGADLSNADIARPFEMFGGDLSGARLERTTLALSRDLFADTAKAKVASIVLAAPAENYGTPQLFTADELARLKQLGNGNPLALIRRLGDKPGFDCAAPRLSVVEKAICGDSDLAALDQLMSLTYRRALDRVTDKSGPQTAQRAFLLRRNACAAAAAADHAGCLNDAYIARLGDLGRDLATVRPAGPLVLDGLPALLAPAVKGDPLAARLLLAFGTSAEHARLEPRSAAFYLSAESVGSNGHTCSFEGELKWDAGRRAWLNDDDSQPIQWLILPDGIALASPHEEARAWCGMRAGWPAVYFVRPQG